MRNPLASSVIANRKPLVLAGILLCVAALGLAALEPWQGISGFFAGDGNSTGSVTTQIVENGIDDPRLSQAAAVADRDGNSTGSVTTESVENAIDDPTLSQAAAMADRDRPPRTTTPVSAAPRIPQSAVGLFTTTQLDKDTIVADLFDEEEIAAFPERDGGQPVVTKINIPKQKKTYRTAVGATVPSDDVEGGMHYEFEMTKDPATGRIPEGVREAERKQAGEILKEQERLGLPELASYSFVGPDNLGGRTRAMAYDVRYNGTSNQIILACGVSGGVYKSTDDGANWVRRSPTGDHFSCTSLAQDPRPGSQDTWYYSVGEALGNSAGASFSTEFYTGNGVYKSTDNGNTWARLPASNTGTLEVFDRNTDLINKVVVDPTNGNIYAAAVGNIVRSTDGGASWNSVLAAGTMGANQDTDIAVTSTGRFYAAFAGFNPSNVDGVWTSTTGAVASWSRIAGNGNGGSPVGWNGDNRYGRIVLAVAPSDESILFVLYYSSTDSLCPTVALPANVAAAEAELFRYDQNLNSWVNLSANLPDEAGCSDGNDPFAVQRGYDLVVAVKPNDPNTIFIGGTNIYRSTNTGSTWTRIGGYNGAANYAGYLNSHADIHSIAFQPTNPNIMLCGNDGGIQRTTNILAGTVVWTPINTGYRTYQYYYVANDPRPGTNKVIGGAQDNGTTRNVGGSGSVFESVLGGDGASVGLSHPAASGGTQFEYVGSQLGLIGRRASTDLPTGGDLLTPTGEANGGLFVTLFKLDPDNTQTLYYANDNILYRTTSASTVTPATWTNMTGIGAAVGTRNFITAIGLTRGAYNAATSSLFFGTADGRVFRLDNPAGVGAATAPVNITGASFPVVGGYVSSIAVSPLSDDVVLVTYSNYGVTSIWYTGNANSPTPEWLNVEGNLTLQSVRSSAIAFTGQLEFFVGTSAGLFSATGLPTVPAWFQEGSAAMGNSVVTSLDLRTSDNKLLVGTHGYGMWTANLGTTIPTPPPTPTPLPQRNNGRIAFSSNNNPQNNREIYTMTATGDDVQRLTNDGLTDTDPSYSPDGSQIVYRSGGNIYRINANGTGSPVQMTIGGKDEHPSWSPDGSQIAFVREVTLADGETNLDVFVMGSGSGAVTAGPHNITNNAATDRDPVWSADGSLVVFTSDRDGDNEIYLVNSVDNSTVYRLTDNSESDDNPAISPADGSLVYVGVRNGNSDIFDQAGTNLTNNPAADDNPSFSPDGQQIVFTRNDGDSEIFTMSKTGGSQTRRTLNTSVDTMPDWGGSGFAVCLNSPEAMVSWYRGQNNAADSHGGNNGTASGVTYVPGRVGAGFKFDGVDDKVEIPDAPSLKPANVAVEAWVRFDSLTSNTSGPAPNGLQYLVFKKNSRVFNFEGYTLLKYPDNRLAFAVTDANGVTAVADSGTTTVTTGEFYHVVGQYEGNRARLFVNGNHVGTANVALTLSYDTRPLFLGTSGEDSGANPYDGKFNGVLDEVTIYNDDLASGTINELYNAGSAGKCPSLGIIPPALPGGTVGQPYSARIDALGGTRPYTFSVTNGTLPAGLALNSITGIISGTPTVAAPGAPVTIRATDAENRTGSRSFNIDVAPGATAVNGKIFFSSDRAGGVFKIYSMNSDGTGVQCLMCAPFDTRTGRSPAVSPNGTTVAYVDAGSIKLMSSTPNTANLRTLTNGVTPAWSPDGDRIVFGRFISTAPAHNEIFIINADGSAPETQVTTGPDSFLTPSWGGKGPGFPQGRIAFGSTPLFASEVYVIAPTTLSAPFLGANRVNLTADPSNPASDYEPDWSPDGRKLVYQSDKGQGGTANIYTMAVPDDVNVFNNPGPPALPVPTRLTTSTVRHQFAPNWSPDGTKIIFGNLRSGSNEILLINVPNPDPTLPGTNLTNDPSTDIDSDWGTGTASQPTPTPTPTPTATPTPQNPPTATASVQPVVAPNADAIFSVTYVDDTGINVSTLGNGDIHVTGPNGFSAVAVFGAVNPNTNGTPRTAVYAYTPPGGSLDSADNGTYNIVMQANQVADTGGLFVAPGIIGTISVNIPQPTPTPTPEATPATAAGSNVTTQNPNGNGSVTFSNVSTPGMTSFTPIDPMTAGPAPAGYTVVGGNTAYDIATTAVVTPPIVVCFNVASVNDPAVFARVRILHGEGGVLVDRTILSPDTPAPNFATRTVCAKVNSLSPFVAAMAPDVSISGAVLYGTTPVAQSAKFVRGIGLAAAGSIFSSASTDAAGAYLLSGIGTGAYTVTLTKSGDVNGISALDASRVAQHAAGLTVLTQNQIIAGDATNNGTLSALDASRIAQFAAGIPNPGIAGQWKFVPDSKSYANVANSISNEDFQAILVGDVTGNWAPPQAPAAIDEAAAALSGSSVPSFIDRLIWNRSGHKSDDVVDVNLPVSAATGAGTVLSLPIPIGETNRKGIVAYEFTLEFDPSVLSPAIDVASTSGTLSEGWSVVVNSQVSGRITVTAFSTHELSGSGTLLNLNFSVMGASNAATPFKWTRFELNENQIRQKHSDLATPFRE